MGKYIAIKYVQANYMFVFNCIEMEKQNFKILIETIIFKKKKFQIKQLHRHFLKKVC